MVFVSSLYVSSQMANLIMMSKNIQAQIYWLELQNSPQDRVLFLFYNEEEEPQYADKTISLTH